MNDRDYIYEELSDFSGVSIKIWKHQKKPYTNL